MIEIDLTNKKLNESFAKWWGYANKKALQYIYGEDTKITANVEPLGSLAEDEGVNSAQFVIRGEEAHVESYAKALGLEASYMDHLVKGSQDSEEGLQLKAALDDAVNSFESLTGLPWPFKD